MINLSAVSKTISKVIMPIMIKDMEYQEEVFKLRAKAAFVDNIVEYSKFTNRHWKKKRELAKQIAEDSKYWIKELTQLKKEIPIISILQTI